MNSQNTKCIEDTLDPIYKELSHCHSFDQRETSARLSSDTRARSQIIVGFQTLRISYQQRYTTQEYKSSIITAGSVEESSLECSTSSIPTPPSFFHSEDLPPSPDGRKERRPSSLFRFQFSPFQKNCKSVSSKPVSAMVMSPMDFEKPLPFVDSEIESVDGEETE
ncbi:hypothetical protein K7432_010517 [Basidiobolus ranarum]|uniref:Uncharacterized protein n=1 Tax=Basidiobolus ranarum TaxID=34480 RepID=A0ABR2WNP9_9FUNG